MKRRIGLGFIALLIAGCGGGGSSAGGGAGTVNPPVGTSLRQYNGTASVGDFLNITVDPNAKTIAYTNRSNGDSGTVSYAVKPDGTYAISDPNGNLVAAYEIPNYGMIIEANKTGPSRSTPALVTAIETAPISLASWGNRAYNFMQFRTSSGGVEVGSAAVDAAGNVAISAFWPLGQLLNNSTGFTNVSLAETSVTADSSGSFLTIGGSGPSETKYVFGTVNGLFAMDTNTGAVLGLQKAASKAFDSLFAGTYSAMYYSKSGASIAGGTESGSVNLGEATISVTSSGGVTVKDSQGNTMLTGTLTAVADAAYLQGAGQLNDACNGLFTVRVSTAASQQDLFMAFQDRTVLFESFTAPLPLHSGGTYDYVYGVGMH